METRSETTKNQEAHHCTKCGLCLATCPVYGETREETITPRAKVQLIKHYSDAALESSAYLNETIDRCLMCGACTANCPSGVRHDLLFMRMRASMAADYGHDWRLRIAFHLLTHEEKLRLAARAAHMGRKVIIESLAHRIKMGRMPLDRLPQFNRRPFREQLPPVIGDEDAATGTVIYFTGCGTQFVYERVGHAAIKTLRAMGLRVIVPQSQVCCGLPLFFHGDAVRARDNILQNIQALNAEPADAVVVDCATCGSALMCEYPHVLRELGLDPSPASALAQKVRDISVFIKEHFDLLQPALQRAASAPPPAVRVTRHAPCHLRNAQGASGEVEELLRRIPGVDYIRSEDMDACCGGGGTFFLDHPDIARRIVERKIASARRTGATHWAAGCPGCRVNLGGHQEEGSRLEMVHPVELVARALQ